MSVSSTAQYAAQLAERLNATSNRDTLSPYAPTSQQGARAPSAADIRESDIGQTVSSLTRSVLKKLAEEQEQFSNTARAAENEPTSLRRDQVQRIKDNISQLKQLAMFASPDQAQQIARELEKLGQEYKQVAKSAEGNEGQRPVTVSKPVLPQVNPVSDIAQNLTAQSDKAKVELDTPVSSGNESGPTADSLPVSGPGNPVDIKI
ncbi:conserved hypothetical protein [Roseibium sp. TrichSKD4]|uniref:hypothetical protein n=1 Tax=Roseibium sp. TrichSKD4 TaxID=744980 RepID=UPI0001E56876|nr:hypothetical protein [Roseibium sp. TrichSKD4]EFO32397.1 conserved hypothetical protein [Roseibium sp. TrichSKD4]